MTYTSPRLPSPPLPPTVERAQYLSVKDNRYVEAQVPDLWKNWRWLPALHPSYFRTLRPQGGEWAEARDPPHNR